LGAKQHKAKKEGAVKGSVPFTAQPREESLLLLLTAADVLLLRLVNRKKRQFGDSSGLEQAA